VEGRRGIVLTLIVAAVTGVYWLIKVPQRGTLGFIDHFVYLSTTREMHHGASFYRAFTDGSELQGIIVGQPRGYRMPTIFLLWRLVPVDWLYGLYIVAVVIGTVAVCCFIVRYAPAAIPVGLYLLLIGRRPTNPTFEGWLMVELWALPAVAGCLVAARRDKPWPAALLAALAALIREVAAVLLVAGLVEAALRRRRLKDMLPWLTGMAILLGAFAVHLAVAGDYTRPPGNDHPLLGTGTGLSTAADAIHWRVPLMVGLVLYVVAFVRIWRTDQLFPAVGLFMIPVLTLFVDREYWGTLLVPFTILFATDWVIEIFATRSYDWRSHGATPAVQHDP
jgi:hypothetical protein